MPARNDWEEMAGCNGRPPILPAGRTVNEVFRHLVEAHQGGRDVTKSYRPSDTADDLVNLEGCLKCAQLTAEVERLREATEELIAYAIPGSYPATVEVSLPALNRLAWALEGGQG